MPSFLHFHHMQMQLVVKPWLSGAEPWITDMANRFASGKVVKTEMEAEKLDWVSRQDPEKKTGKRPGQAKGAAKVKAAKTASGEAAAAEDGNVVPAEDPAELEHSAGDESDVPNGSGSSDSADDSDNAALLPKTQLKAAAKAKSKAKKNATQGSNNDKKEKKVKKEKKDWTSQPD
jgi:hypothetical protein